MKIWKPMETYGKIKRKDGSPIQYAPFFGHWNNDKDLEVAFNKEFEINPDTNKAHYHEYMKEIYFTITGYAILLLNEKEEIYLSLWNEVC